MDRRDLIAAGMARACTPRFVLAQPTPELFRIGWLEYRGGDGAAERLAVVAAELVRLPADLIVAPGTSEALAARKATGAIPIVKADVVTRAAGTCASTRSRAASGRRSPSGCAATTTTS